MPNHLIQAGILGVGSFLPERILTNKELEKKVDTTDQWIRSRTGIRERRIAESDMSTSDLALRASRKALENAGIEPEELDLIILTTCS